MSINRVSRSLLLSYGPLAAANNSSTAASAISNGAADTTTRTEAVTPAATLGDPVGPVESALDAVLRRARLSTASSTNEESNAGNDRHAPAIGLYQRVSQYSEDRSTASDLVKSWNDIVRENQFEDAGVANHVKAVARNDALALPARVLNVTV